jgi:hypothetical protein
MKKTSCFVRRKLLLYQCEREENMGKGSVSEHELVLGNLREEKKEEKRISLVV